MCYHELPPLVRSPESISDQMERRPILGRLKVARPRIMPRIPKSTPDDA